MNQRGSEAFSPLQLSGALPCLQTDSRGCQRVSGTSPGVPGVLRAGLGLPLLAGQDCHNKNPGDADGSRVILVMMISLQQATSAANNEIIQTNNIMVTRVMTTNTCGAPPVYQALFSGS